MKNDSAFPEGIVTRSTGSWYRVRFAGGEEKDCRMAGKMRLDGLKSTNPVAVGDRVAVSFDEGEGIIREVLPRTNYVLRKAVNLSKRVHILCANIDQAILLFTLDQPVTTLGYADRLLVSCDAYNIPVIIVFNKVDLLQSDELNKKLSDYEALYRNIGYQTVRMSANDDSHAATARELLKDKVSFVMGRSGAGKSSFIHLAEPELGIRIGEISDFSGRGKHTTTFAEMFPLSFGGFIIDSPGFKEMEIYGIEKSELGHFFPEMRALLGDCKFNNCIHVREPGCAVKAAVEAGSIAESRYHTYLGMLEEAGKE